MKALCAFLLAAFLTTEVFGLNLRNKRQAETNNNPLEDRYGFMLPQWYPTRLPPQWNTPPMPDRRFPGQRPIFGQYPDPGYYPDPSLYPGVGTYPYPMLPNQQFPYPQFPDQGRYPLPDTLPGPVPLPGQVTLPGQGTLPDQAQQTTQNPTIGTTTPAASNPTFDDCIANCPVTAEYNPVCGTNNVTYPNPGRLYCAQACGTSVNLLRSSPCPATTVAPPSS